MDINDTKHASTNGMKTDNTRQHCAEICECVWNKIITDYQIPREDEDITRKKVALLVLGAWNTCLDYDSYLEIRTELSEHVDEEEDPFIRTALMTAADLKWQKYREDYKRIGKIDVKTIDGVPRAIVYYCGEPPHRNEINDKVHRFIDSPEIQERLKNLSDEELKQETNKLFEEFISKHRDNLFSEDGGEESHDSDGVYDYPIRASSIYWIYTDGFWVYDRVNKKERLNAILVNHPALVPLCKDADECFRRAERKRDKALEKNKDHDPFSTGVFCGSVPEMIIAIANAFYPTTDIPSFGSVELKEYSKIAGLFTSVFLDGDRDKIDEICAHIKEPGLFRFIHRGLYELNLTGEKLRTTMKILFAWGLLIGLARVSQHPDDYQTDIGEDYDD